MKTILHTIILAAALLAAACSPIPPNSPNPLDTPEALIARPESAGRFGHDWMYR